MRHWDNEGLIPRDVDPVVKKSTIFGRLPLDDNIDAMKKHSLLYKPGKLIVHASNPPESRGLNDSCCRLIWTTSHIAQAHTKMPRDSGQPAWITRKYQKL